MKLSDFDFELPDELIAQQPLPRRDDSRMMVIDRDRGTWEHRLFRELPDILEPGTFLTVNVTRVLQARVWGRRPGRAERIEVLLLGEESPGVWTALLRPARKLGAGDPIEIGGLRAECREVRESGQRLLRFDAPSDVRPALERIGRPPLPPYIRRSPDSPLHADRERYQTVFARVPGSVAAPTAALHFTPEILDRLQGGGVPVCEIVLHVGYGTFQPIRTRIVEHAMHSEFYEISPTAADCLERNRRNGKRLVAVGTSTTRALEYAAGPQPGAIPAGSGWCDTFIYPGYRFRAVEGLLTNFHLPRSTLLLLVSAFAGTDLIREAYQNAIRERYRFFSYGDCMLIR